MQCLWHIYYMKCSSVITEIKGVPFGVLKKYESSKCVIILYKLSQNVQIVFELITIQSHAKIEQVVKSLP